ncbi:MAG: ComF family protein [Oricola sp.]|nr:ComF family protein [Oricola sp.]
MAVWSFFDCGGSLITVKGRFYDRGSQWAGGAAQKALDLAMPPHCPLTREGVASGRSLSAAAWSSIHFIDDPVCGRCGVPFSAEYGAEVECPSCIAAPPDFERARAAVVYDDASYKLIVGFKHGDRTELADMLGAWMVRAGRDLATSSSVVTPVPLHGGRLLSRRFNQSALLAAAVAAKTGARLSIDGLARRRATPPQKDLSAEGRRRNVAGAFEVRNPKARALFHKADVVLIDDVLTTGATLSAAARALKRAGAARVDALVLARVVKGGLGAI